MGAVIPDIEQAAATLSAMLRSPNLVAVEACQPDKRIRGYIKVKVRKIPDHCVGAFGRYRVAYVLA